MYMQRQSLIDSGRIMVTISISPKVLGKGMLGCLDWKYTIYADKKVVIEIFLGF